MYIFNNSIKSFIEFQTKQLREVSKIIHIPLLESIKIYVHEHPNYLGLYHHKDMIISFDISCVTSIDQEIVRQILLHELAHHLAIYHHGENIQSHGKEFSNFCKKLGIESSAKIEIKKAMEESKDKKLLEKVQKLLKLGSSSNPNEAEAAILKANQILVDYNLSLNVKDEEDPEVFMAPVFKVKKISAKTEAISLILKTFNVFPVWSQKYEYSTVSTRAAFFSKKVTELQVSGNRSSVEIAQWIGSFLDEEFDRLWLQAKKEGNLKGMRQRNSFFTGIADGYMAKYYSRNRSNENETSIEKEKRESINSKMMILKERSEELAKKHIYKNLRNTSSSRSVNADSYNAGLKTGQSLSFNVPIKGSSSEIKKIT